MATKKGLTVSDHVKDNIIKPKKKKKKKEKNVSTLEVGQRKVGSIYNAKYGNHFFLFFALFY